MPESNDFPRRPARRPALQSARVAAIIAACVALASACAPREPLADDGITKRAASLVGVAAPVTAPADFVRDGRPGEAPKYIPVGVTPPKRELQPRGAAGVASLEAELDAQRNTARTFATRPAPAPSYDGSKPPKVEPPPTELLPQ